MIIPTTGIVFLFGAFVFIFLTRRFWQCYRREGIDIAKFFSYSFLLIGLNYIVSGIPCLFLIENQTVWQIVYPLYVSLMIGGWFLFSYSVFWERFKNYREIIATLFSIIFLSIVFSLLVLPPPHYFYTDGTLNWEVEESLIIPAFLMMLLVIIPAIVIFFQEAKRTGNKKAKIRSLGFGIALTLIPLGVIIDFLLLTVFKVHPIYSDLNWFIMISILAITLIVTWGPPRPKYVTKIE